MSTTFMLRSFSRYLSSGWPETKKPSTSFSFCRRVCSSHSATLGSASSLLPAAGWTSAVEDAEEPVLAGGCVRLRLLRALHRLVERGA